MVLGWAARDEYGEARRQARRSRTVSVSSTANTHVSLLMGNILSHPVAARQRSVAPGYARSIVVASEIEVIVFCTPGSRLTHSQISCTRSTERASMRARRSKSPVRMSQV